MAATSELRFDTGRTCLDLLATVGGRLSADPVERLDSEERLTTWLHRTGLLPGGQDVPVDAGRLEAFTALRTRLHRVIHAELDGTGADESDLQQLNRVAAAGQPAATLVRGADGTLRRRLTEPVMSRQLLAAVADDAIRLLSSPEREMMRQCEGSTCDLVYLDTSRGRRRRWCSPAACGNRHNVAAHRARKAASA